jgi:hypothetical protein
MADENQIVDEVAGVFSAAPKLHSLADGETARLEIGYFKSPPRDTEGATVSFHLGGGETTVKIVEVVEPQLDKRKFRVDRDKPRYKQKGSWDIGWVEVNREGEIVEYEIKEEYLKPTEQ